MPPAEVAWKKRVAIYVRVSTAEQATEGFGLESQKRILRAYVEANADKNWCTSDDLIYSDEGVSGATEVIARPELSRLKGDVLDKQIDVLLVWKIDRLFRKTSYLLEFMELLKKNRVNFVSKNENIDLSSHTGKLVLTLIGAIAEMEREVIAERTLEGKKTKSMQGYVVYGKYVPFGYMKVRDGRGSLLAIDPVESEIVKEIFRMYAHEWKSSGEIARILTERNVGTNIDRGLAEGEKLRPKLHTGLFRQHSIMRILQNPTYTGIYTSNKSKSVKNEAGKTIQIPKDSSEWISIPCDRLIDNETFAKTQELIPQGRMLYGHGKWGIHLFTGLVRCAECGRSYAYYQSKKKTGNYSCAGRKKGKVSTENRCTNGDISEIKIMSFVWPKIELFLKNPGELIQKYGSSLRDNEGKEREERCRKLLFETEKSIVKKKSELKEAFRREIEQPEQAEIFSELSAELANELQALEKQKETLSIDLQAYDRYEEHAKVIMEHSKAIKGKLKTLTEEEKAKIMRELLEWIYIGKHQVTVKYRFLEGS